MTEMISAGRHLLQESPTHKINFLPLSSWDESELAPYCVGHSICGMSINQPFKISPSFGL